MTGKAEVREPPNPRRLCFQHTRDMNALEGRSLFSDYSRCPENNVSVVVVLSEFSIHNGVDNPCFVTVMKQ